MLTSRQLSSRWSRLAATSMLGLALAGGFVGVTQAHAATECSDGVDNDNDGFIDHPGDVDCTSSDDTSEATTPTGGGGGSTSPFQCSDGRDNDNDGFIDHGSDPDCTSTSDNSEAAPASGGGGGGSSSPFQCSDGRDNDNDGYIDHGSDPDCTSTSDNTEATPAPGGGGGGSSNPACSDGRDNDNDGYIDSGDSGCTGGSDTSEGANSPACSDAVDNDGDSRVDYPHDPGCSSASDPNEGSGNTQCSDDLDNDNDGFIDYPHDPGCDSSGDNNEGGDPNPYPSDTSCAIGGLGLLDLAGLGGPEETLAYSLFGTPTEDGPLSYDLHRYLEGILDGGTPAEAIAALDGIYGELPAPAQAALAEAYLTLRGALVEMGPTLGSLVHVVIHEVSCIVATVEDILLPLPIPPAL